MNGNYLFIADTKSFDFSQKYSIQVMTDVINYLRMPDRYFEGMFWCVCMCDKHSLTYLFK